jgi:DNA-binding transcriptional MerR regulator
MRTRERGGGQGGDRGGVGGDTPEQQQTNGQPSEDLSPTKDRWQGPGAARARTGVPLTKLYFRIGEVAQALGVETHVLRYWETEFRSIRPQKSKRGQRVYSRRDVETLARVKELLYDRGFTIVGARRQLRDGGIEPREPSDPTAKSAAKMRAALLDLRGEIVALIDQIGQ